MAALLNRVQAIRQSTQVNVAFPDHKTIGMLPGLSQEDGRGEGRGAGVGSEQVRRAQEEVSCAQVSDEMMPSCRPLYASLLCHTASLLPLPLRKPPPTPCRVCACRTTATTAGTTEAANRPPTLPLPPKAQLAYQLGPASNSSAPQGAGFSCPWDAAKQLRPGCGELLVPCSHSLGDDGHVRTRCAIHGRKNSGAEQLWRADSPALSVAAKLPPPPGPNRLSPRRMASVSNLWRTGRSCR